uniref:Uncharacterized protein n=1 Tax=Sphaerodactylus townsendi TaxID=933632 RepID=A0ACB8GAY7_9SAUR
MLASHSNLRCTASSRTALWGVASEDLVEVLLFLKLCMGFYVQRESPREAVQQSWESHARDTLLTVLPVLAALETEIDRLEEKLTQCREALEEVDFKLRRKELTPEGRKSLEKEKIVLAAKAEDYGKCMKEVIRDAAVPQAHLKIGKGV